MGTTVTQQQGGSDPDGKCAEPGRSAALRARLRRPGLVLVLALTAVSAVPVAVGVARMRHSGWIPMLDVAAMELRVRDVGSRHSPQVGPFARFEYRDVLGNHPGPISYYAVAPVYRLLGSAGWALGASAAVLNMVAVGVAVWVGHRRAGRFGALAVGAMLTLLVWGYGVEMLNSVWNPDLALVAWVLFLLAAWSVMCRDYAMLPVAVVAGSVCAQNHVAFVPVVGLVAAVATGFALWHLRRVHREGDRAVRRPLLRWLVVAGGLGFLLWLPPLVQEVRNDPGNVTVIVGSFGADDADEGHGSYEDEHQMSLRQAGELWLSHLNVDELLSGDPERDMDRNPGPGAVLLLTGWAATAVMAWRWREPLLGRLHLTIALALLASLFATTRIMGAPFFYLTFWMWGTTALMLLATLWSLVVMRPRPGPTAGDDVDADTASASDDNSASGSDTDAGSRPDEQIVAAPGLRRPRAVALAAGLVVGVVGVALLADSMSSEMPDDDLRAQLDEMIVPTVDWLEDDPVGCGADCRYLVSWHDPVNLGSHGVGMLAELERRGFDAYGGPTTEHALGGHRVLEPAAADAVIHLALGDTAVGAARARDGGTELSYVDVFTAEERDAQRVQAEQVAAELDEAGFHELASYARDVPVTDGLLPIDPELPTPLLRQVQELNAYLRPTSVTVIPGS